MTDPNTETMPGRWRPFLSLAEYRAADFPRDLAAGLTLAAIAIPEQMATARLGGFAPALGFTAFLAGSIAFAIFGANRFLSAGADSTITPIFASGLAILAATGSPHQAALAAMLALVVGGMLVGGGLFRLGWIADLLSIPVTTGFLAGIAVHIIVSQLPTLLGLPAPGGSLLRQAATLTTGLDATNLWAFGTGLGVFLLTFGSERISPRIPGPLVAVALATIGLAVFGGDGHGVTLLGAVPLALPGFQWPNASFEDLRDLMPTALVVAAVVMVQTAATTRSFVTQDADVDRDFIGIGMGNILAGLMGAFPVDASPPRTAIVAETGGKSQIACLAAAALVLALLLFGAPLLAHVPEAALAGILLFIAFRIIRVAVITEVYRSTLEEFSLIILTMVAIVVLPIGTGVACGIAFSLLHGMWSNTNAQAIEFARIPGSSIWWAPGPNGGGETIPGVVVIAWQAPLSFLNAYRFQRSVMVLLGRRPEAIRLLVLESSNMISIDFTGAKILGQVLAACRKRGIDVAIARLESLRAQDSLARFGLTRTLGPNHVFPSVAQAIEALGKPA